MANIKILRFINEEIIAEIVSETDTSEIGRAHV